MIMKEHLQYGLSMLVVLGLLGLLAQKAQAEDRRLDTLCGDDRSGCITQTVEQMCATGQNWPGAIYECDRVEFVPKTPQSNP